MIVFIFQTWSPAANIPIMPRIIRSEYIGYNPGIIIFDVITIFREAFKVKIINILIIVILNCIGIIYYNIQCVSLNFVVRRE